MLKIEMEMKRIMKYDAGFICGCLGAMAGGLVAALYLSISNHRQIYPLEKEREEVRVQIGEKYKRLFDEYGFSISYNDFENRREEDEWVGEEIMKVRRIIFLSGQIREIKNRKENMYLYWSSALFGGFVGFGVGRGFER